MNHSTNPVAERIRVKLEQALAPEELEIVDETDLHIGHPAHHPDGESHFRVTIVASLFRGCRSLERHRLVYSSLTEELAGRVHALSITALAPDEQRDRQI